MDEAETLLLAVLNSAPVVDGRIVDELDGEADWIRPLGGTGSTAERERLRETRDALHRIIRGDAAAAADLTALSRATTRVPTAGADGLTWRLEAPPELALAARTLLAWDQIVRERPGRLRACANEECNLFLIDRSRPGTARWCSMGSCGNRAKVRAFAERRRASDQAGTAER